ncbi:hypothetical protein QQS21_002492 [Conoideocrella luteorostrata]|uniref:Uncharacterized protein n=1 Tax=Conoideocrella luteorostrata TaxID=1105319 RepID=A0AAJ0G2W0_9HYPO|nr:hypothetical protein QQS21_002492 [Conoideocrella luteorostrata]
MVPCMAEGAAMAVEDAIKLAECLERLGDESEIPELMAHFQNIRLHRRHLTLDGARKNGAIWHLPDRLAQQERDKKMVLSPHELATQSGDGSSNK